MKYISTLRQKLSEHFSWNKSRIEILSMIIFSLFKVKSICFSELSQGCDNKAKADSTVKRIYRFMRFQGIEALSFGKLILNLLGLKKFVLIIDRTNWEFGIVKLNILYLAISYHNIAVPIFLKCLDNKGGSSKGSDRIELLEKFLQLLPASNIEALLGDREFFSDEWLKFLTKHKIPFVFRAKYNQLVRHQNGGKVQIKSLIKGFEQDLWIHFNRRQLIYGAMVKISCKLIKGEYMILIYFAELTRSEAIRLYKLRWQIECMFKFMKTSGFNIECTHITKLDRLSKMLHIVTIAFAFIAKFGLMCNLIKPIKIKKHNRPLLSLFTYGLNAMRKILLSKITTNKIIPLLNAILDKQAITPRLFSLTVRY